MPADFYDLLEVDEDASESEIKRAYREKATHYHPDVNDDPRATDQFATLNRARDVLTDSKERARYDRLGHRDYVSQHLDGLPTMTRPGRNSNAGSGDAPEGRQASDSETGSTATDPEYGPGTGGSGTATNRTHSRTSGSRSGSRSTGSGGNNTGSSGTNRSDGRNESTGSASSGSSPGTESSGTGASSTSTRNSSSRSTSRTRPSANGSGASATASTGGPGSSTGESGSSTAGGRRSSTGQGSGRTTGRSATPSARWVGLRRGWIAAIVALGLYLAGVGAYVTVAEESAAAALASLASDPVNALTAASPLADPVAIALAAVQAATAGDPTVALLVPLGVVALPLTVTVSVVRFGQGTAYLYGAGVLVPLVWAGARTAISAPLGADLAGLVVVPLLAALWFLFDVGRYLRG